MAVSKPWLPGTVLAVSGAVLLGVGAVVTVVSAIGTSITWFEYSGLLSAFIWFLPYAFVCFLIGTTWAGPLFLASVIVSAIGLTRSGWTRWLGIPALLLGVPAVVVSAGTWILLLVIGILPWTPPPAS